MAKAHDIRKVIERELISTNDVCKLLNVTSARLCKIKELKAVVRGFYLRSEVEAFMGNEEANKRREIFLGKSYKAEKGL